MKSKQSLNFIKRKFGKIRLYDVLKKLADFNDSRALFYKMLFMVCLILAVLVLVTNVYKTPKVTDKGNEGIAESKSVSVEGMVLKEVSVVVDAGHGGNDWGTHFGSIKEKSLNLDIALRFGKLLEDKGINVIYTRKKDKYVNVRKRPMLANDSDATLYISIHNNNLPGNSMHQGTETLYASSVSSRFKSMNDKKLAEIVESKLTGALGTQRGGIIKRTDLAVLHHTKMPAVIAEIGYLSNKSDRSKLKSKNFRQKAAEALCDSVMEALSDMGAYKDKNGKWMVYEIDQE